jgi:glycyl-tRNA synthetase beta subunit
VKEALTVEQFEAVIEQLSEATGEQIVALVDDLITKDLDTSQATLLITSPAVLENITTAQAEQLFSEIAPTELSPDEAEAVVEAVQSASSSVRKAFESVLNIFQGFADNYVPLNSTVPVSTRRALIAVSAVFLTVAPAPTRRIR